MEDFLIGVIKFFGETIDTIIGSFKGLKALLIGILIVVICFIILYFLIKMH